MTDRILGPSGQPIFGQPGGLIGPDGLPVKGARVGIYDDDMLVYQDGFDDQMPVKQSPSKLLMEMARRQRDGASLQAIISEFDLMGEARSPFVLQRALARGREMLDAAIASGKEPAESPKPRETYRDRDDD